MAYEQLVEMIRKEAENNIVTDDPEFDDFTFGGNFDDAYSAGVDDGYVMFARQLLNAIQGD